MMARNRKKTLKLGGRPFTLRQLPPGVVKIKSWLEAQPKDELRINREVMAASGLASQTLNEYATRPELADYRETLSTQRGRVWGHPEAIAELRRQLKRPK
jgi:hypothetical protein